MPPVTSGPAVRAIALAALFALLAAGCGHNGAPAAGGGDPGDGSVNPPEVKPAPLVPPGSEQDLDRYVRNGLLAAYGTPSAPDPVPLGIPAEAAGAFATVTALADARAAVPSDAAAGDFSTTNLQEVGVDEADTVKFDGTYLYIARQPTVYYGWVDPLPLLPGVPIALAAPAAADAGPIDPVASVRVMEAVADPPGAKEVASIPLPDPGSRLAGLYLRPGDAADRPDLLVTVGEGAAGPVPWVRWMEPWWWRNGRTAVTVFDVTHPEAAAPVWDLDLEGYLVDSRMVGDVLYLVTRFSPYLPILVPWPATDEDARHNRDAILQAPVADLLPKHRVDGADPEPAVRPARCFLPKGTDVRDGYPVLVTVTAIDVRHPKDAASVCMGGVTSGVYASPDALYLAGSLYDRTVLHKFAYTPDGPAYRGSGVVKGNLGWRDPRFRMGEKDGVLRVLTTRPATGADPMEHLLTLLAEADTGPPALDAVSHLPNADAPEPIGKPGEDVYAVRFSGDRGYVVTFKRIDPLYVLDLADPKAPRIAGSLEVPGFSDYLHPVGDTLLVGVGRDAPTDPKAPALPLGVRVALFDVADPAAPALVDAVVIGKRGSYTEVSNDPHAFTFLRGADGLDRMALPIEVHGDPAVAPAADPFTWYDWFHTGLYLFEVDEGGPGTPATLTPAGALVAEAPTADQPWSPGLSGDRGVLQGPAVHYVHGGQVWSAPWDDPGADTGPR